MATLLASQKADVLGQLRLLRSQSQGPLAIGVGGGECSGKTYFSHNLVSRAADYGLTLHVIALDGYLRYSRAQRKAVAQQKRGIEATAYEIGDHADCFDLQQARMDIIGLVEAGILARFRHYDYSIGQVVFEDAQKPISSDAIVIIEGIFALHKTLIDLYRFSYFLEADNQTLLERYVQRHVARGGEDQELIKRRFIDAVVPCYKAFIEPTRENASALISTCAN